MKPFLKYLTGLLIIAMACEQDEPKPADIGLDYFPLRTGFYRIYAVDEINYSEVQDPDTLVYQLMVEVVDSLPDPEGGFLYIMQRSKRTDENALWQPLDTWSARGNDRELIVNEGNTPYVKLTFPLETGNSWNGNKFNTLDEDEYQADALDEPFEVEGTTFDSTVHILQENNDDLIVFFDKREEVYARKVGLVYREITQLHFCTNDNCLGQQVIEKGRIYKQQIIDYGDW